MAQDVLTPVRTISPAIEDAIERTWPSKTQASGADDETPFDVRLRVTGFFLRLKEQKQRRESANIRTHAAEVQASPPEPQTSPEPAPPPSEPRSSGPPDALKALGYAALGIGAAVIVGKTLSSLSERKQQRRRLALAAAEEQADELDGLRAALARSKDARRCRQLRAQAQPQPAVIDTTALEPKLQSWVYETITKNFEAGMAVQHVHQHEHVQHLHPTTRVEHIVERAVPGPRGATGPRGDQGKPGEQGKRGERGPQGPQGRQGRQGKRGAKGQSGKAGRDGAPIQGHQPKTSTGFFDG